MKKYYSCWWLAAGSSSSEESLEEEEDDLEGLTTVVFLGLDERTAFLDLAFLLCFLCALFLDHLVFAAAGTTPPKGDPKEDIAGKIPKEVPKEGPKGEAPVGK